MLSVLLVSGVRALTGRAMRRATACARCTLKADSLIDPAAGSLLSLARCHARALLCGTSPRNGYGLILFLMSLARDEKPDRVKTTYLGAFYLSLIHI